MDIFLENLLDFDKNEKKLIFRVADIEFKVNFSKSKMADIFSKNLINLKENEYKKLLEIADNEFDINSLRSKIADNIKWIELNKCINRKEFHKVSLVFKKKSLC